MAYDNNTDKVTFIKKTGSEIISNGYEVDISSLLDSTTKLSSVLNDSDEIMIVRKFDSSSITPAITSDETWSSWVLPSTNTSGSTMYTMSGSTVTLSQAAADYTWTTAHSGRGADVALPVLASGDTVYILRKTYALQHLVTWTAGSKITSSNLNLSGDQFLYLSQELISMWQNIHNFHPSIGQPNGLCPLNASGIIHSDYITSDSITLTTSTGISGSGNAESPIILDILDDSLVISGDQVKVDTQDTLTSTSTTKPLSAAQGKVLKDNQDLLGSGVVYKGVVDVEQSASSLGLGSAVAGWTVNASVTGTAHSDFGGAAVTAGDMFRYGTSWQAVSGGGTTVLASGTQALTGNWDAGAFNITTTGSTTPTHDATGKRLASLDFVQQELQGTKLEQLEEVTGTPTAGDILKRNAANDNWVQVPVSDTTDGISIGDLSNVDSGADSPSSGQTLEWSGSAWAAATGASVTTQITCSGAVTGDASTEVKDAMNHTNLGSNSTTPVSTSTQATCTFLGRTHYIGASGAVATPLTLPHRKNITYKDGVLKYDLNDTTNSTMISLTSTTSLATTTSAIVERGASVIVLTSITNFRVGDHLWITADNTSAGAEKDIIMKPWIRAELWSDTIYASSHAIIENIDSTTKEVFLDKPLNAYFTAGATVTRYGNGAAGSDGGADQLSNIVFDNMTFEDTLAKKIYLPDNPISLIESSTVATLDLPTGHGLATDASIILHSIDCTDKLPNDTDINGPFTVTLADDEATIATGSPVVVGGTGADGDNQCMAFLSVQSGINIEYGNNITFKNCTFKGWNQYAIRLFRCYRITFENCRFINCNPWNPSTRGESSLAAIVVIESDNVTVKDCVFTECTAGIAVSSFDNRATSDLTISNNSIQAIEPITHKKPAPLRGVTRIEGNTLLPYDINKNRFHVAQRKTAAGLMVGDAAIDLWAVESFEINDNDMVHHHPGADLEDAAVDQAAEEWDPDAFWGNAKGFTLRDNSSQEGGLMPTWAAGIWLTWVINRDAANNLATSEPKNIKNNRMNVMGSGIFVELGYNAVVMGDSSPGLNLFVNLNIKGNTITSSTIGIGVKHAHTGGGNFNSDARVTCVSDNNITVQPTFYAIPGSNWSPWSTGYLNGTGHTVGNIEHYGIIIWANVYNPTTGISGRFNNLRINRNNISEGGLDQNIGIYLHGGAQYASPQGAFRELEIKDNWITNFAYSTYVHRATTTTRSIVYYGLVTNNKFHSPGSGAMGYHAQYIAGTGNYYEYNR